MMIHSYSTGTGTTRTFILYQIPRTAYIRVSSYPCMVYGLEKSHTVRKFNTVQAVALLSFYS